MDTHVEMDMEIEVVYNDNIYNNMCNNMFNNMFNNLFNNLYDNDDDDDDDDERSIIFVAWFPFPSPFPFPFPLSHTTISSQPIPLLHPSPTSYILYLPITVDRLYHHHHHHRYPRHHPLPSPPPFTHSHLLIPRLIPLLIPLSLLPRPFSKQTFLHHPPTNRMIKIPTSRKRPLSKPSIGSSKIAIKTNPSRRPKSVSSGLSFPFLSFPFLLLHLTSVPSIPFHSFMPSYFPHSFHSNSIPGKPSHMILPRYPSILEETTPQKQSKKKKEKETYGITNFILPTLPKSSTVAP